MEKKFNYLYKITNLVNGKFYYGIHSTNNLDDGYMGSGTNLNRAYEKYGIENFKKEILEFRDTREEISNLEKEIVTENLIKNPNCYNISLGGDGWNVIGTATMMDENGNHKRVVINSNDYNNMVGHNKNKVVVYSLEKLNYIFITKDEYYSNKNKYKTVLNEKTIVFDTIEKCNKLIDIDIYHQNKERYLSCSKGKTTVLDIIDNKFISIPIDEFNSNKERYKGTFFGKTHSEESKQKISDHHKSINYQKGENNSQFGTCWITNGKENKKIKKEELDQFLQNGWEKGRKFKKKFKKPKTENIDINNIITDIKLNMSNINISKKYNISLKTLRRFLSKHNIKVCWIYKNSINKKILESELDNYLKKGWKKGRLNSDETKQKMSKSHKK